MLTYGTIRENTRIISIKLPIRYQSHFFQERNRRYNSKRNTLKLKCTLNFYLGLILDNLI